MGNTGSGGRGNRSRRWPIHTTNGPFPSPHPQPSSPAPPPLPEAHGNHYPLHYPDPPEYYAYPGFYHPPAHHGPLPTRFHPHTFPHPAVPSPYFEHQKAMTIRNDVDLKKETLRVEPDEENPGYFLVAFTFDATVDGSVTIIFFAKGVDCNLIPMEESLKPIIVSFKQGLGKKFRQPSGTGINFSQFKESELLKGGAIEVYPLAVKEESSPSEDNGSSDGGQTSRAVNSQITEAKFEMRKESDYQVKVVKQILWVNDNRYELQEISGIGNSVDGNFDENDPGKECVICLSEPRSTTVLPCWHMRMCEASGISNK